MFSNPKDRLGDKFLCMTLWPSLSQLNSCPFSSSVQCFKQDKGHRFGLVVFYRIKDTTLILWTLMMWISTLPMMEFLVGLVQ